MHGSLVSYVGSSISQTYYSMLYDLKVLIYTIIKIKTNVHVILIFSHKHHNIQCMLHVYFHKVNNYCKLRTSMVSCSTASLWLVCENKVRWALHPNQL